MRIGRRVSALDPDESPERDPRPNAFQKQESTLLLARREQSEPRHDELRNASGEGGG
jgi:hypothetical protein